MIHYECKKSINKLMLTRVACGNALFDYRMKVSNKKEAQNMLNENIKNLCFGCSYALKEKFINESDDSDDIDCKYCPFYIKSKINQTKSRS